MGNWRRDPAGTVAKVLVRVTAGATGLAVLLLVVWATARALFSGGCGPTRITNDQGRLRQIAALAFLSAGGMPMKDGAFDPYEFVRRGDIPPEKYDLFRSERLEMGPSKEEIERGDYTNLGWERYRGDGKLGDAVFPLLWERKSGDKHGGRLVAFSDGAAMYCEGPEFAIRRIVGLVAQSGKLPMKDGAFDPYLFVREGQIPRDLVQPGPTDADIERSDYTNFPWERYRGDGKLEGMPFPLLWERKPDEFGGVLAGLSDGTLTYR